MAIGFKNPTNWDFDISTNNIIAGYSPNQSLVQWKFSWTKWNPNSHIIVRGEKINGISKSHISQEHINELDKYIKEKELDCSYIMDTSHDNSCQDRTKQPDVLNRILKLKTNNIVWYMTESYLYDGKQKVTGSNLENVKHGLSLTDWCIGRDKTEILINELYNNI
jgi:3-deoxy-7-phosphoheptulonate synthase